MTKVRDIDQLVQAAAKIFAEKGFEQARIEDIAGELGLLKGSLYYHVASKNELLFLVVRRAVEPWIEAAAEIAGRDEPARERLRVAILTHVRYLWEHPVSRLFFEEALEALQADQRAEISRLYDQYTYYFVHMIEEGVARGEFRPNLNPRVTSLALVGMMNWSRHWVKEGGPLGLDAIGESFAALVLDGMEAGPAGFLNVPG